MKEETKTPQQILNQSQEEFEDNLLSESKDNEGGLLICEIDVFRKHAEIFKDKVYTSTLQAFLEAEIARERVTKQDESMEGVSTATEVVIKERAHIFNQAKNETISHFQELLTKK